MASTTLAHADGADTDPDTDAGSRRHSGEHGTADDAVVVVRDLTRHYGPVRAVDGVDLDIRRGELFGLIGHNGAGKSTLFKMLLGLIPASGGRILIDGVPVGATAGATPGNFRAVRRHIGYLPENVVLYDNLTGLETLQLFARLKAAPAGDCPAVLARVGLAHAAQRRVREYSKGMRQRLGFAQALLGNPRLLFLDEPTTGLDPEAIHAFYATLQSLRDEGVTMVLTSHILAEIQERVDRLAIMAAGKVRAVGTVQALRDHSRLPLRIEVRLADGADPLALHDTLAALPADDAPGAIQVLADGLSLQCPRTAKLAVLAACLRDGTRVADVHVHEPSLEDVFFGFAAPGEAATPSRPATTAGSTT